jgi:tetratricopeptide (TPR) repeat protein
VTGNTSQSAVARAAEEDVDRFILKPYTVSSFVNTLALAFVEKLFPNEYRKTIENGKTLLFAGKIDESMQAFEKAMEMDPSPSLACFYYGQAEILKQAYLDAQGSYLKGLNYNRIHYKCLIGLFELLMQREMYAEAYAVVRRMQKYFPANPKRFASVIRLAVVNRKFADIEQLYSVFTEMEFREREVMRYMCAGLVVSAQHAFSADSKSTHAEDLLKKVAVSCAGDPYFLRRVIEVLSENKRPDTMQGVLSRFPPDLQKSPDFLVSSFLHLDLTAAPGVSLQAGQALLRDGHHMPFVYRTLCRRYLELGKKDQAEDILREGIRRFPKEYSVFRPLVEMVPQVKKELNIA